MTLLRPLDNSIFPVPAYPGDLWPYAVVAYLVAGLGLLFLPPAVEEAKRPARHGIPLMRSALPASRPSPACVRDYATSRDVLIVNAELAPTITSNMPGSTTHFIAAL